MRRASQPRCSTLCKAHARLPPSHNVTCSFSKLWYDGSVSKDLCHLPALTQTSHRTALAAIPLRCQQPKPAVSGSYPFSNSVSSVCSDDSSTKLSKPEVLRLTMYSSNMPLRRTHSQHKHLPLPPRNDPLLLHPRRRRGKMGRHLQRNLLPLSSRNGDSLGPLLRPIRPQTRHLTRVV